MSLKQQLNLRQTQNLTMTPKLMQAIKLLQYANVELSEYVNSLVETNPFLETNETSEEEASSSFTSDEQPPSDILISATNSDSASVLNELDTGTENIYADASEIDKQNNYSTDEGSFSGSSSSSNTNTSFEDGDWQSQLTETQTLRQSLMEQLFIFTPDPIKRLIGISLIDHTDDNGYMTGDIEKIAQKFNTNVYDVEEILLLMQECEPTGVMARNLAECLKLQLLEKNQYTQTMHFLIENLNMLASHDLAALCHKCGIQKEELPAYIKKIRTLNPKPGSIFEKSYPINIVPDVFVKEDSEFGWKVYLNNETLPKVLVNKTYYTYVNTKATKKDKKFIEDNFQEAHWLIRSMEQRAQTILKVTKEIILRQDSFLIHGIEHIKPMKLKDVATSVNMHESTVSRVTNNKYVSTPKGIFELRFFFSTGLNNDNNIDGHSATKIKHLIRHIVNNENAHKTLSDDKIVAILKQENSVTLARRTVTKYREAMNIGSSVQRRKEKALNFAF